MHYVTPMIIAAKKAGNLVLSHFRSNMTVYQKSDGSLVTDVDLATEILLKQELKAFMPEAGFIAEESGAEQGNEYTWVIDPIDGTRNFKRGLPYFCISIALMHHAQIIAVVTYAPAIGDLFYAQKGFGAWLHDKRLLLQPKVWKQDGILAIMPGGCINTENRLDLEKRLHLVEASCKSMAAKVSFRMHGAAALDLAYVAAGMIDVIMFENFKWWDVAAGILLIQESGGLVTSYDSLPIEQSSMNLIAGNRDVCDQILLTFAYKK